MRYKNTTKYVSIRYKFIPTQFIQKILRVVVMYVVHFTFFGNTDSVTLNS